MNDYEKEAFLVCIHTYREDNFREFAFYWKGEWMFFDSWTIDAKSDKARREIWFHEVVKGFAVPGKLLAQCEVVIADLKEAITTRDTVDG